MGDTGGEGKSRGEEEACGGGIRGFVGAMREGERELCQGEKEYGPRDRESRLSDLNDLSTRDRDDLT